jgi:hypothetical protein
LKAGGIGGEERKERERKRGKGTEEGNWEGER